jgi:hypothetical protein
MEIDGAKTTFRGAKMGFDGTKTTFDGAKMGFR